MPTNSNVKTTDTIETPRSVVTELTVNYNSIREFEVTYQGNTTLVATATTGKAVANVSGKITYTPVDNPDGYDDTITIYSHSTNLDSNGDPVTTSDSLVIAVTVLPQPETLITKLDAVNVEINKLSNEFIAGITPNTTFSFVVEDVTICEVTTDNKIKGLKAGTTTVLFTATSKNTKEVTGTVEVTVFQSSLDAPTTSDGLILDVTTGKFNRFTVEYDKATTNLKVISPDGVSAVYDGIQTPTINGVYSSLDMVTGLVEEKGKVPFMLTGKVLNKNATEKYILQTVLKDNTAISPEVELTVNVITTTDSYVDDNGIYTNEELLTYLTKNIPFDKKMALLREYGSSEVTYVLDELDNYVNNISIVDDTDDGCNLQLGLYDLLMRILKNVTTSEVKFKLYFHLVNLYFKHYSEILNDINMHMYLDNWNGRNKKSLQTYKNIAILISSLCDITTRQANLNTIDLDSIFDMDTTNFTTIMRDSLIKYYVV